MHNAARMPKILPALKLVKAGFRVLPLHPNDKKPVNARWQEEASSDPDRVHAWWKENPDYNIGVLGDNHLIVDIDVRRGGLQSWLELTEVLEAPPTLTVKTWSGGYHLRFSLPEGIQVGNSSDEIAPGIDIKGFHGQVVGPGSTIDGKTYQILTKAENGIVPLAPKKKGDIPKAMFAPEWLIKLARGGKKTRTHNPGVRLNDETPEAIAMAAKWVLEDAPRPAEGQRNSVAYAVAAKAFDTGIELSTGHDLMGQWNEEVGLDLDELATTVESAYRNRRRPIGVDNPGAAPAGMEEIELPTDAEMMAKAPAEVKLKVLELPKRGFLTFEQSCQLALRGRDPLVDKVLYAGDISATYGDSGARKTMMMMDMFFHMAWGRSWHGFAVPEQVATFWVAAEGGLSAHLRNRALMAHYKPEEPIPFGILEQPINLLRNAKDTLYLIDEIKRAQDHYKRQIGILEIDTYNAVASGSDEGVSDTGVMMEQFRLIRERIGRHLHINVTHHTGKDLARGMRGSSSLRAGLEATIEVRKDHRTAGTAWLRKSRDGESDVELLRFEAKNINIGPDEKGRALSSQVIVPRVTVGMAEVEKNLSMERPWEAEGVSKSWWYERRRKDRTTDQSGGQAQSGV